MFFHICTHEILVIVIAIWQIGKDQKCSNKCRCPLAQPSQEERPQEHQITAKAPENNTIFSSSSSVPIHVESSPSSPEIQTQQIPSPPQSVSQPQEAPSEVLEHTADPADLITSSVVPPEQTSTAPPQGNILTTKLSPIDTSLQIVIILVISQLTSSHRQL